ncbi:hypothetical protein M3Y97_01063500 [Aphelenchoides bicaudatus]|nr:hypothetical protein M3Y97_01063500 [Aphelenchoides bicaudatus]
MKRKAQESLDVYEHSAQIFRSPARRPVNTPSLGLRLALSDTNIEPSQEESIFPALRRCTDGVTSLCLMMAETSRTSLLARFLREQGVTTIGKFASLTPSMLEQIPYLKKPKHENAVAYLKAHIPNNMERESPPSSQDSVASDQGPLEFTSSRKSDIDQHKNVEMKVEDETQDNFVFPENEILSLDMDADAQPTRSPRKEQTPTKRIVPLLISPCTSSSDPQKSQETEQLTADLTEKSNQLQEINDSVQEIQQSISTSNENQVGLFSTVFPSNEKHFHSTEVQTSPVKETKHSNVEQQTSPTKKQQIDFNIEDSSASDVTNSQVGNVLKKKIADLNRLVNNAFPPNSEKTKLTVAEQVRNLQTDFLNQSTSKAECSEMVSLLLDFAKLANERASTLDK